MNDQLTNVITTVMLVWRSWNDKIEHGERDRGSSSMETVIIVAIVGGAALVLAAAIMAAIQKYQAQIP